MNTKINTTCLALLLALRDLETSLSEKEKKILADVADQLYIQPKAWEDFTEPSLLKMIEANPQFNKHYQTYKLQLDKLETIAPESLPTDVEVEQVFPMDSPYRVRGFKPQSPPRGYEAQINNIVILVGRSEKPEEVTKNLNFLDRLKQSLLDSGQ